MTSSRVAVEVSTSMGAALVARREALAAGGAARWLVGAARRRTETPRSELGTEAAFCDGAGPGRALKPIGFEVP